MLDDMFLHAFQYLFIEKKISTPKFPIRKPIDQEEATRS